MSRPALPLALVLTLGLLAGCTVGGGDDAPESSADTDAQATRAVEDTVEDLQSAAGEDAEPVPVQQELPVLATRTSAAGSIPLEIELNSVTATGQVMTVVFTARNTGEERWQISEFFDDGSGYAPLDDAGTRSEEHETMLAWSTDGVAVLDPVNGRLHRAAYDSTGSCACNVDLGNRFVGPGEAVVLTTAFGAPPEEVTHVTVQIPGAGSFDDVPLGR